MNISRRFKWAITSENISTDEGGVYPNLENFYQWRDDILSSDALLSSIAESFDLALQELKEIMLTPLPPAFDLVKEQHKKVALDNELRFLQLD
jgi:hypothetical protein